MNIWTHLAAYSLIETQRLYLRPFLFEDAEDFYKIASNPDNLQFIFPAQADLAETQYVLANYFMKILWGFGPSVIRKPIRWLAPSSLKSWMKLRERLS